ERFIGRDAVTTRTIGHRNLAVEDFRETRHTDPERRFTITLRDGPERLCIRHTVILRQCAEVNVKNRLPSTASCRFLRRRLQTERPRGSPRRELSPSARRRSASK